MVMLSMEDTKDEDHLEPVLVVALASSGVLAILAMAAVILCYKSHRDSVEEREEEGEKTIQQLIVM